MRAQPCGAQGCHHRNKAVDDHRDALGGSTQKDTAHGAQVKAAHLGKHIDRIVRVGLMLFQRLPDDLLFHSKGLVQKTAAPSGDGFH